MELKQKLIFWLLRQLGWVHFIVVDNVNNQSIDGWWNSKSDRIELYLNGESVNERKEA